MFPATITFPSPAREEQVSTLHCVSKAGGLRLWLWVCQGQGFTSPGRAAPSCSITPAHQLHALPWTQAAVVTSSSHCLSGRQERSPEADCCLISRPITEFSYSSTPRFCGQKQSQRDLRFYELFNQLSLFCTASVCPLRNK